MTANPNSIVGLVKLLIMVASPVNPEICVKTTAIIALRGLRQINVEQLKERQKSLEY